MGSRTEQFSYPNRKESKKVSEEHIALSNFIKKVHSQLRKDSQDLGADEAWEKHVTQNEKLKAYAESMYKLATNHWEQNSDSDPPLSFCRVQWIRHQCKEYFLNGGKKKFDNKEKALLLNLAENEDVYIDDIESLINSKIQVLDVGSCYNPFSKEEAFFVTAIDIAPYSSDVEECDFLNLTVGKTKKYSNDHTLIELPGHFDAVIFSLVLEYIPCPKQRFSCCQKAYNLLRYGGILLIATPDSKHQNANTKIINSSWKVILAKLGFLRIQYEKLQHLHCMVFRKCYNKEIALKRIDFSKFDSNDELFFSEKIFIPQDFQERKRDFDASLSFDRDDKDLVCLFSELPCDTD